MKRQGLFKFPVALLLLVVAMAAAVTDIGFPIGETVYYVTAEDRLGFDQAEARDGHGHGHHGGKGRHSHFHHHHHKGPKNSYGAPPKATYGAPPKHKPKATYGAPPKATYGAPPKAHKPKATYGPPKAHKPKATYGPPKATYGAPTYSPPAYEAPSYTPAAPAYSEPAYSAPAYEAPKAPAYSEPAYSAPAYEAPKAPAYSEPAYSAPAYEAPKAPSYSAPAYEPPAYSPPSYSPPSYSPPAYEPPAYSPPSYSAPSYSEPASYTPPVYESPAYSAPAYDVPAYDPPKAPESSYSTSYEPNFPPASTDLGYDDTPSTYTDTSPLTYTDDTAFPGKTSPPSTRNIPNRLFPTQPGHPLPLTPREPYVDPFRSPNPAFGQNALYNKHAPTFSPVNPNRPQGIPKRARSQPSSLNNDPFSAFFASRTVPISPYLKPPPRGPMQDLTKFDGLLTYEARAATRAAAAVRAAAAFRAPTRAAFGMFSKLSARKFRRTAKKLGSKPPHRLAPPKPDERPPRDLMSPTSEPVNTVTPLPFTPTTDESHRDVHMHDDLPHDKPMSDERDRDKPVQEAPPFSFDFPPPSFFPFPEAFRPETELPKAPPTTTTTEAPDDNSDFPPFKSDSFGFAVEPVDDSFDNQGANYAKPSYSEPAYEAPVYYPEAPSYSEPAYNSPSYSEPAYSPPNKYKKSTNAREATPVRAQGPPRPTTPVRQSDFPKFDDFFAEMVRHG